MSKAFATVMKSFMKETERAFEFLVSEFGLAGPVRNEFVLPAVEFTGPGVRYEISLDLHAKVASTDVAVNAEDGRLVAELGELVIAANLGTRQQIRVGAHNLNNLQKALESQASFVRLIHPLMNTDTTIELMKKANARKWRRPIE